MSKYLDSKKAYGYIVDICDSIVSVSGLGGAFSGEVIHFQSEQSDIIGWVWDIEDTVCKIPLLSGSQNSLQVGEPVFKTNRSIHVRCGFSVLGEIFNPLGSRLTDSSVTYNEYALARLFKTSFRSVDMRSPGIVQRSPVTVPFMTGVSSVDSFIPVGCGQRELIIGDQNTGKTSLAITAIINQSSRNNTVCGIWRENDWCNHKYSLFFPCIYVSIGSKRSEIVRLRKVLESKNALHYTCIIFTSADDLAALQYMAPFIGCAVGEWFMAKGYNSVAVYDDLSQHAVAFRQLALLLRRPPGREAYPGDVFFLHARLLERAAQLLNGGSLTALPVIQTLGGDLSGYISTNVISITDGQIFLVKSLINKGIRPAVDLSLSVSRVGSAAQYSAMSFVSKRVKSVFSMYRIYAGIAKLGGEDQEVMLHVSRGERLLAFFTQDLYQTYSFYKQVVCLYSLTVDSTDFILPSKVNFFFMLLSFKQFNYLLRVEKKVVSFFLNTNWIESLLMVFSFDIIKKNITTLIINFSSFFFSEIQDKANNGAETLLKEIMLMEENQNA